MGHLKRASIETAVSYREKVMFRPSPTAIAQFNRLATRYYSPETLFNLITQFAGTADFDKGLIYTFSFFSLTGIPPLQPCDGPQAETFNNITGDENRASSFLPPALKLRSGTDLNEQNLILNQCVR